MKIDYEYKAQILSSYVYEDYREISKAVYNYTNDRDLPTKYTYEEAIQRINELCEEDSKAFNEAYKLNHAFLQRKKKLKKKIQDILCKPCIFATFTISDDYIDLPLDLLRKYLTRVLKEMSDVYIANEDYGKNTNRLHFHAIIQTDHVEMRLWKYGFMFCEKINNKNVSALATYITKLTNHAIKASNKRSVMIYSKKKK